MGHFNKSEFFDFDKMDERFLLWLDQFRDVLNQRMDLTSSNRPNAGHVTNSDHDKGCAVDFTTPATPKQVIDAADKAKAGGFGLYRTWNGRFYYHVAKFGKNINEKWIGLLRADGKTVDYVSYNRSDLKRYFGIV